MNNLNTLSLTITVAFYAWATGQRSGNWFAGVAIGIFIVSATLGVIDRMIPSKEAVAKQIAEREMERAAKAEAFRSPDKTRQFFGMQEGGIDKGR